METSFRADNGDLVENPFAKYITGASAGASSSSSSGAVAAAATSSPSAFSKEVDVEVEVVVEAAADEAAAPPSAAAAAVAKVSKRPVSLSPAPPRRMSNDDMGISGGTNGGGSRVPSRVPFFYPALLVGGALVGSAFGAGSCCCRHCRRPCAARYCSRLIICERHLAAWLDVKILAATCAELAVGAYNGVGWLVVASGQAAVGAAVGTTNGVFWLMTTFVQAAVAAAAYFGAVAQGYLNAVTSVALAAQALAFGALARTLTLVGAGAQRTAGAVTGGAAAVATGGASGASAAASGVSSVAASGAAAVNVAAQSVASLVSAVYQAVLHVVLHAAPTALLAGLTQLRLLLVAIATAVAAGATSLGTGAGTTSDDLADGGAAVARLGPRGGVIVTWVNGAAALSTTADVDCSTDHRHPHLRRLAVRLSPGSGCPHTADRSGDVCIPELGDSQPRGFCGATAGCCRPCGSVHGVGARGGGASYRAAAAGVRCRREPSRGLTVADAVIVDSSSTPQRAVNTTGAPHPRHLR